MPRSDTSDKLSPLLPLMKLGARLTKSSADKTSLGSPQGSTPPFQNAPLRPLIIFILILTWGGLLTPPAFGAPTPAPSPKKVKAAPLKPSSKKTPPKKKSTSKPTSKTATKQASKKTQPQPPETAPKSPDLNALSRLQGTNAKEPTFIKSDTLTLNADERVFIYSGNVEVKQGLMTLTCGEIEGRYNTNNQIDTIDARRDVVIIKEEIRGTAQKAFFDAKTNTVTLTENPEVQQNGSILSADSIKIFLNENRSVAEGTVRVKLIEKSPTDSAISLP
jgi:lipopolysaccharide transport protein LptA